jgi:hypothetical protein
MFKLDGKFHYGQNSGKTFRYIVYHPPWMAGRERKMYQVQLSVIKDGNAVLT